MKIKIIFKVLLLVAGLLMVVMFRQFSGSRSFTETIAYIFGTNGPKNSINWCVDKVVDVSWTAADISESLKQMSLSEIRRAYCELQTEPIADIDLDKVQWAHLAESLGPTGQKTILEWNRELELFRTGGMPFKSSKFSAELKQ